MMTLRSPALRLAALSLCFAACGGDPAATSQATGVGGSGSGGSSDAAGGAAGSGGAGGAGGDGGAGPVSSASTSTTSTTSTVSTSTGPTCFDSSATEPGDADEAGAAKIPVSCDDGDKGKAHGVLNGPGDVDWWVYTGEDKLTCKVNPTQSIESDAGTLRLCAFVQCVSADTTFDCPGGTETVESPGKRKGCCSSKPFTITFNCEGTISEDANVYFRVDDPEGLAVCPSYTITYHY